MEPWDNPATRSYWNLGPQLLLARSVWKQTIPEKKKIRKQSFWNVHFILPNVMKTTRNASKTNQSFMAFTLKLRTVYLAVCEPNLVQGILLFILLPLSREWLRIAAQAPKHQKKTFLLSGWSNTGTVCWERLGSLHPGRHLKLNRVRPCTTRWPCFEQSGWTRWSPDASSNLNSSLILWSGNLLTAKCHLLRLVAT